MYKRNCIVPWDSPLREAGHNTVTNFCGYTANYTSEVKTEVATIFGPYLNLRAAQHLEEILGEKEERKSVCPF